MKRKILLFAGVGTMVALCLFAGPPLWQRASIWRAVARIEAGIHDGKPTPPEHGGIVRCRNGEWVVIDLHHGTLGYTLAYTSRKDRYLEVDYNPHPVIECWSGIIYGGHRGGYESISDFFEKNGHISWKEL